MTYYSEKIVNDNAEGYLRHYIMDVMGAPKDETNSALTGRADIRRTPEFASVCSSYAVLQAQKTSQRQQDELTKQNIELTKQNTRPQRWLVVLSAIAVIVPIAIQILVRV